MAKQTLFTESGSPLYLQITPFIDVARVEQVEMSAGFSTKHGGESIGPYESLNLGLHTEDDPRTVVKNREKLAKAAGFQLNEMVVGEQIHSNQIKEITASDRGAGSTTLETAIKGTDGFFTKDKGVLLVSMYADCVPLYFFAPKEGLVGLAHAGWKGTVGNIAGGMLKAFKEAGAHPKDVYTAIGPSISMPCYEVDERVVKQVNRLPLNAKDSVKKTRKDHYLINLKAINRDLLLAEGVQENRVFVSTHCTYEQSDLFYSHRRDNGKTGRMMSFIGLR
ncbi:peptidoglycan editing factor PgeF [Alteribacter aurantiacus]|uniref:peptidoglycan editing factor PgeF n=1 Tax=Alteribacter aurantiacus TaxID=254410 RepID=UPI00041962B5|nr:peptidoglycan editing factor PgeF [Alteribacter aurantiacus]